MVHLFCDLPDSSRGDPVPLFHCKGMICCFELDVRSQADGPGMNRRFQVQGLRVAGNGIAEPSEMVGFVDPPWILPEFTGAFEVRSAERNPYAPRKQFIAANDGNLDKATDEEVFVIYYALVREEFAAPLLVARRNRPPSIRCIEMPRQRRAVKALATTRALKSGLIHL